MDIDLIKVGGILIILAAISVAGIKASKGQEGDCLALFMAFLMTVAVFQ
ncbi:MULTISPECIES: hypothetical protein [Rhizobium]|nr:hypothetical protein [Rhizobium rosettiformans]